MHPVPASVEAGSFHRRQNGCIKPAWQPWIELGCDWVKPGAVMRPLAYHPGHAPLRLHPSYASSLPYLVLCHPLLSCILVWKRKERDGKEEEVLRKVVGYGQHLVFHFAPFLVFQPGSEQWR